MRFEDRLDERLNNRMSNRFKNRFVASASALVLGLSMATPAHAGLKALTCEPEWAALITEIGGDKVQVSSATTALQDPHRIEARPSLIAKARNADLLVCTGLELEVGWLPILLQQAGNGKIEEGKPGHLEIGALVPHLDMAGKVDRSEGDVHAGGNPHIQQNPHNIAKAADAIAQRLAQLDQANAALYAARHQDFSARWKAATLKWEQQGAPLKGVAVVEHHKNMAYLLQWLGMRSVATLEPKPGVEPSAAHLSALSGQLQKQPAKMVLRAAYQDGRASQWLTRNSKINAVVLPFTVGGDEKANNLFALFDLTLQRLLEGAK
jgi:zinc/manganese transport system substrate-binding protein